MAATLGFPGRFLVVLALMLSVIFLQSAPAYAIDSQLDLGVDGRVRSDLGLGLPGSDGSAVIEVVSPVPAVRWLSYPTVGVFGSELQPNAGICRDVAWLRLPPGDDADAVLRGLEWRYALLFGPVGPHAGLDPSFPCPVDRPKLSPEGAEEITRRYVRSDQLPRPELSVPPGYALAGMPAYLVTGHSLAHELPNLAVNLGVVQASLRWAAEATMTVDWGDGTVTTHSRPGTGWPDGEVVHTYVDGGTYTITVTDTWTVSYEIDEVVGTLTETLAPVVLEGVEVRERVAVRTGP